MINDIISLLNTLKQLLHLHKFSKDVIHGSAQFSALLYLFAAVIYLIAPYTSDYLMSVRYYQSALEIAPVILAGGIVSALLCDLILGKYKPDETPS
ncbi:MAG TPA: hypothetical protein DEB10_15460, partial [Ruminococcaceae bacterium]|nr:hypothetical protein [Oscillospiraceae bacterium]